MDQAAYLAVVGMLEELKDPNANPDLKLQTFETFLEGYPSRAIIEAAERFTRGEVPGQSDRYAPKAPQFINEVRKRQQFHDLQSRPKAKAVEYHRGAKAPFQIRHERALRENEHRPVIKENVTYDEWRAMSLARQLPPGAQWVAATGIIYGPEKG